MSLESETSGSGRDWFFPSPSFLRSSSSQYGHRFYSNSKPCTPPTLTGIRHRRRVKFPRTSTLTNDKPQVSNTENAKSSAKNNFIFLSQSRFQFALVVGTRLFLSLCLSVSLLSPFLVLCPCGCRR